MSCRYIKFSQSETWGHFDDKSEQDYGNKVFCRGTILGKDQLKSPAAARLVRGILCEFLKILGVVIVVKNSKSQNFAVIAELLNGYAD